MKSMIFATVDLKQGRERPARITTGIGRISDPQDSIEWWLSLMRLKIHDNRHRKGGISFDVNRSIR